MFIIKLMICDGQGIMGEAKRRKKLDPNYGKPVVIGGKTDLEWKKEWCFTDREWQKIKPYFRVVNTVDDVDKTVDGVWIYTDDEGDEVIVASGSFVKDLGNIYLGDIEEDSLMIGGKPDSYWLDKLPFENLKEDDFQKLKLFLKVVDSIEDVDISINAIWAYEDEQGEQKFSFTGFFAMALDQDATKLPPGEYMRQSYGAKYKLTIFR